jgi:uncharacterized protein (TIGR00269 family)
MENCAACERPIVYFRICSGEKLCRGCFVRSIENKVRETISRHSMIKHGDKVALALSGGKDSTVLVNIIAKLGARFPGRELLAITVDEGIAGYRDESIRIARKCCSQLGVDHLVVSFKDLYGYTLDEIRSSLRRDGVGLGTCSYCGVLRRRALNSTAKAVKADKLITAHSLDDEVQTIMLNILRGDILRLSRIAPGFGRAIPGLIPRVKPLREVPEEEIALYAFLRKIEMQQTPCPYARESMRNDARMMINTIEKKHPGTRHTILHSFERLSSSMKTYATADISYCKECGEPSAADRCKTCEFLSHLKSG